MERKKRGPTGWPERADHSLMSGNRAVNMDGSIIKIALSKVALYEARRAMDQGAPGFIMHAPGIIRHPVFIGALEGFYEQVCMAIEGHEVELFVEAAQARGLAAEVAQAGLGLSYAKVFW